MNQAFKKAGKQAQIRLASIHECARWRL